MPPRGSGAGTAGEQLPQTLPAELRRFLALRVSRTLLVRGGPGTGRTLLGRAMLSEWEGPKLLLARGGHEGGESAPDAPALPNGVRTVDVEDAQSLQEFLPERKSVRATPLGAERRGKAAMLVVEDWAALRRAAWEEDDRALDPSHRAAREHEFLRTLRTQAGCLVLILGEGADPIVDHAADGIIELEQLLRDERLERWARIVKLRGVEVEETHHPFTLVAGRFRSFPPFPRLADFAPTQAESDPAPQPTAMWPGSRAFATAFGRLPLATMTLLEVDATAPLSAQLMLPMPFFVSTVRAGGRVVFVPPPLVLPEQLSSLLPRFASAGEKGAPARPPLDRVRFLSHLSRGVEDADFRTTLLRLHERESEGPRTGARGLASLPESIPADSTAPRFPETHRFVQENPAGAPNAMVIFVDGMVAAARQIGSGYTPDSLATVLQRDASGYPVHIFLISREDEPIVRAVSSLVSLHLRLRGRHGRYFVHGTRPRTPNYALEAIEGAPSDASPYGLTRIA